MFRKLFRKTPLAWLQLKREKTRLAIALAGIAFADVLMLVQLGLKDALYDSVAAPYRVLQGDLFMINPLFESLNVVRSFPRERLYQAAGMDGVESINYMYIAQGEWRNPQNRTNQAALVWGIDPNKSAISLPEVQQHQGELKLLNRVLYDRGDERIYLAISLSCFSNRIQFQFSSMTLASKSLEPLCWGHPFRLTATSLLVTPPFCGCFPLANLTKLMWGYST